MKWNTWRIRKTQKLFLRRTNKSKLHIQANPKETQDPENTNTTLPLLHFVCSALCSESGSFAPTSPISSVFTAEPWLRPLSIQTNTPLSLENRYRRTCEMVTTLLPRGHHHRFSGNAGSTASTSTIRDRSQVVWSNWSSSFAGWRSNPSGVEIVIDQSAKEAAQETGQQGLGPCTSSF